MPVFRTLVHPTDFDEPSKEAFRVARSLAEALGARVVAFHVVAPPAVVSEDGRVILDPKVPEPRDLFAEYRKLAADTPKVAVQFAVVVADGSNATRMLDQRIRELGEGTLLVMGTHGRTGLSRFFWGANKAEEIVRECPCPVLVVKAHDHPEPTHTVGAPQASTKAAPSPVKK
jgi:nucleotide-binding universal stress UspA family protein